MLTVKASEVEETAAKGDHKSLCRIVTELTGQRTESHIHEPHESHNELRRQMEGLPDHMTSQ